VDDTARAHESHPEHSFLADQVAANAVTRIDYDFERHEKTVQPSSNQLRLELPAASTGSTWTSHRHPRA
jgi:O-methyltransferase involved in polyketide biosynthesis